MGKVVKIGCCGFPVSRRKYYKIHRLVELQNTFYNLPSREWAEKIRAEAPREFEFTVKAWQVITHPYRSPTWRKLKNKPAGNIENYGWLKPTRENLEALIKTLEIADVLEAKIIVLQTPGSMPYNEESKKWILEFFDKTGEIISNKYLFGWEPRGEWAKHISEYGEILREHRIIHVVDPFRYEPVSIVDGVAYYRLHGIGGGEVNYRYKYSVEDLEKLATILEQRVFETAYVLFNNVYMLDDSMRFKEILKKHPSLTPV